jgi:RNA polymerase sigma-70 factor, ECF subfamily
MSQSEEQLVARAKTGSRQAGSELVGQHYERIYAYLRRLCGDEEEASDLTQRTFIRLWSALPSYAGRSSFSTWAHGIAYHVYADWRRGRRPGDWRPDEWWNARLAPGPSPFDDAAQRDLASQLYGWVEALEDEDRQAIHLHYYQGLSLAETAELLGVAASTVKYRLREAIDRLRARALAESPLAHPA